LAGAGLRDDRVDAVLAAAEQAMLVADRDPVQALPLAEQAARRAHRQSNPTAAAIAERAWGHALLHCGQLDDAIRHLRRSVGCGMEAGSPALAAEARLKLAFAILQRGRPRAALAEIDLTLLHLTGAAAARARAQRAIILHVIGRLDESLAEFDAALVVLRETADLLGVQRMLINRALVYTDRHAFGAAERDLREAEELARQLGRELTIGLVANNLGLMETLRADVPAGLSHLDRAERIIGAHGAQLGTLYQDRTELLLSVGVLSEAQAAAEQAVAAYRREGRLVKVPEARLLLSRVALLSGDREKALTEARRALGGFGRQERPEWAALARLATLRAQQADGLRPRLGAQRVQAMVDTLTDAGWPAAALEARLVAAQLAERRGSGKGRVFLEQAARIRHGQAPAALRARGWYASALLRLDSGDPPGALLAARTGLGLLADHSAAMGATDLRVHAAVHRNELAELGLRIALRNGRPEQVLEWSERGRVGQLQSRPVRPPDDPRLARLLAQLRALTRELDKLPAGGRSGPLLKRQAGLEREVRDHARLARGDTRGRSGSPVSWTDLADALADRALVEFVQLDGELHAITMVQGRIRLSRLGPLRTVAELTDRLPFALQRLARDDARPQPRAAESRALPANPQLAGAAGLLRWAAATLDELLFRPLTELADRPLVLVPTGPLHSLPWSILPSCQGRPVTVSPSATLWHLTTRRRPVPGEPTAVVAGPRLRGADDEAKAVAQIYAATPLSGVQASVEAVLGALSTAGVVHLAAHGRLRSDNPLFSDLQLADGPLVLYDLEQLARVPHTVVLAACESGRAVVHTGDELLGLSATFLARGAAQLVASVVPIPDAETTPLMVAFHRRLAAGQGAATALAEAQQQLTDRDPRSLAASAGFVCLGSGQSTRP
jgi:tetratricopeptide (TPR) repeat protein